MPNYTEHNSHDPKTDHRSLQILVGMAVIIVTAIGLSAYDNGKRDTKPNPSLYMSFDGCKVYRFEDENGHNYFARCPAGEKVSVTDSHGNHVITQEQ